MNYVMKLAVVLFAIAILGNTLFAQDGQVAQKGGKNKTQQTNWVDADGDGVCDKVGTQGSTKQSKKMNKGANKGMGQGQGLSNGSGDGTGLRPQDGTGFGRMSCDGTGSGSGQKGSGKRGGRK